jgi:hypothetical protein
MRCHNCGDEAIGVCRFCGRAVCQSCHAPMPYIMSLYVGAGNVPKAIVVADVLWCRTCRPQPEPIEMPELY